MSDQRPTGSSGSVEGETVDLMSRAARGDSAAFDQLIHQFWTPTFLYAASLTRDADRAADLAQDAFARLWTARQQIVSPGSVGMYLLRSVRNSFISERRRWKVRVRWLGLTSGEPERSPRTPLQETESAELREAMRKAIADLAPRRREAFTLFHVENLSQKAIAELMGIRAQSVANLLQAAVGDLRTALQGYLPRGR
jgi:RNA polymerase sigma-70 factor (ECF subfamily)